MNGKEIWNGAVDERAAEWVKKNTKQGIDILSGRIFEYLGYFYLSTEVYTPEKYILLSSRVTPRIRKLMSRDEQYRWRVSIPDGILLEKKSASELKMIGLVEYKMPNPTYSDKYRDQFDGITRLSDFLKCNNGYRGKKILRSLLEVDENTEIEFENVPEFIYVVPSDRSTNGIRTTMDRITEIKLPIKSDKVRNRVRRLAKIR